MGILGHRECRRRLPAAVRRGRPAPVRGRLSVGRRRHDPAATAVVSAPSEWTFPDDTCWYCPRIHRGDTHRLTAGGRHYWMLGKTIRLACAHRLGCVTEADHKAAVDALEARFTEVLASTGHAAETATRAIRRTRQRRHRHRRRQDRRRSPRRARRARTRRLDDMVNNGPQQAADPQHAAGPASQKGPPPHQLVTIAGRTTHSESATTAHRTRPRRNTRTSPSPYGEVQLGLRTELAKRYFHTPERSVPSSSALTDALASSRECAWSSSPRSCTCVSPSTTAGLHRSRRRQGPVIEISGGRWQFITDDIPVMFRRTKQTATMPEPERGGKIAALEIRPGRRADRPILVAVLVSALIQPDVPHVILAFITEHGSAKSSAPAALCR